MIKGISSKKANRRGSSSFLMFKDLECKEEFQKVKMAGFLRELHKLATEEAKQKVLGTLNVEIESKPAEPKKTADMDGSFRTPDVGLDDGTISLLDLDVDAMTPEQAASKIKALHGGEKFTGDSLMLLIQAATNLMGKEETVVDLRKLEPKPEQVTVVGDLHGSLGCLQNVLELVKIWEISSALGDSKRVVVFDGDFVDRGENSLEVLSTLLLLKLSHPTNVFLLRGNHEDSMTASTYGFMDEIEAKYGYEKGEEIWYEFGFLFASFPIVARSSAAAIMHGGIPMEEFELDVLNEISKEIRCELKTVVDPYDDDERLVQGVLWSDPSPDEGIYLSDRGAGYEFGPDIVEDFLTRHDLNYVIRAHEPFEDGSDLLDIGDGRGVVTIFSTANYPNGEGTNSGAILHLNEETRDYETVTFEYGGGTDKPYKKILKQFVDDNKSRLTKAFRAKQNSNGFVTCEEWADVIAETLGLPDVPWLELQPDLAPTTVPDGTEINWIVFLNNVSTKVPITDEISEDQMGALLEHKDKFLNIFQLLDTDGSGTISEEEFTSGIKMLNDEMPEGQLKMTNPGEFFRAFDVSGDGEIDIEEFVQALHSSAALKGVTESLDVDQVENLQQNHEMLQMAFKYLDKDHSGGIDREEFESGVALLNKRLDSRHQLGDPHELFDLLDLNGDGEIDINEFNQMFRSI